MTLGSHVLAATKHRIDEQCAQVSRHDPTSGGAVAPPPLTPLTPPPPPLKVFKNGLLILPAVASRRGRGDE